MEPGYYRYIKPIKELEEHYEGPYELGELWYLLNVVGDSVNIVTGDDKWDLNIDEFEECFEFAPNGLRERQEKMLELTTSLHNIGNRQEQLRIESADTPSVEEEDVPVDPGTEIALKRDPAKLAISLKKTKTLAARAKTQVARRQKALQKFMKEQEIIMRERANALSKTIKQAEQVIYVLNAYLGKDEEIVQIADGEPAPADTKIVMRQLILFMDEETAAASNFAKRGGLDWKTIDEFDEWIKDPKNLKQCLPEEKGVVAFKPRRNNKFYDDNPFINTELNRQNKCLYILIRNGEKLYRIYTTLWLDDVFFPRKNEFDDFFYGKCDDKRLRPGSRKYMEAMDEAEANQRRYYTVLILLQGLLDRTHVFEPLPETATRVNICNIAESEKYLTFLYDAEMVLGDGRPDFDEWLEDVNSQIDVGCRVIFEEIPWDVGWQGTKNRMRPSTAKRPNGMELHRIEKRDDEREDLFKFYYSREGETVYHGWGDWEGQPAKNRASFLIGTSDDFVLNFDAVTVEDMEYYIGSRLHRHHYEKMIPLMQHAIKLKKKEKKAEAPFRKLLVGQIIKEHGASQVAAEARIDELIKWWKFKNRNHRALTEDDSKAIRMIVREFKKREDLARAEEEKSGLFKEVVQELRKDEPNTLAIFHKKDNLYAVYLWHNDDNVWVREETWQLKKDESLEIQSHKDWKVVDTRHESWNCLWSHPRWDEWQIGAVANDHLTDTEIKEALDVGMKAIPGCNIYSGRHEGQIELWRLPLAATIDDDYKIKIYYAKWHAHVPENLISGHFVYAEAAYMKVKWDKKRTGTSFKAENAGNHCIEFIRSHWDRDKEKSMPWELSEDSTSKVLFVNEENIALVHAENAEVLAAKENKHNLLSPYSNLDTQVHNTLTEQFYAAEKVKFLDQYYDEDDELWEDHKAELKKPNYPYWVDHAVELLVEKDYGHEINGMTVGKLIEIAKSFDFEVKEDDQEQIDQVQDLVLDIKYGKEDKKQ